MAEATVTESDPREIVTIHHPKTLGQTTVRRRSFEKVWSKKGFLLGPLPAAEVETTVPADGALPTLQDTSDVPQPVGAPVAAEPVPESKAPGARR